VRGDLNNLRRFFGGGGPRPVFCDICGLNVARVITVEPGMTKLDALGGCERCLELRRKLPPPPPFMPVPIRTVEVRRCPPRDIVRRDVAGHPPGRTT
jgi:hypothetical protein